MMAKTTRFDTAEYLGTPERRAAYINAALETDDMEFIRDALGVVARARGMTQVAKETGLSRESLYKALGSSGNPEFETVIRLIPALGLQLSAHSVAPRRAHAKRYKRR
jgi:probable addiction module antidote protein